MGKFESEFSKWIRNVYGDHDNVQKKCHEWMRKKDKELKELENNAKNFEKEMEKSAQNIEGWLKKHQSKWTKNL